MTSETALDIQAVTKTFGDKVAVNNLTLRLQPGDFLGLLGRNGAGKSTTLNMVCGLLQPTTGSIRVLGHDVQGDPLAAKRQIGIMPEGGGLMEHLTGTQYLYFVGRMYGLDDAVVDERRRELFDVLALDAEPGTLLVDYSTGMKKKVALSAALIHAPRLVLLDEPFEGVDPVSARTIREILAGLRAKGVTLVLTSHVLEIVEKLCSTIAILDAGELLGHGSLDEIRSRLAGGADDSLEALFVELMGGARSGSLSWW